MMHIAICDDEEFFCQRIHKLFLHYCQKNNLGANEICLSVFTDPNSLLALAKQKQLDLVLLDIGYSNTTGIDVAHQLQKLQHRMLLIYVTSLPEFSVQGYETNAFRYLLKKDLDEKFDLYIDQAFTRLNHYWHVNVDYQERIIPVDSITFLEIQGRMISVHFYDTSNQKSTVSFNGRLKNIAEEIPLRHFLKVQKSHLVNPQHIQNIYNDHLVLSDNTIVTINRSTAKILREQLLDWEESIAWNM